MSEEEPPPPPTTTTIEKKVINHFKKSDSQKENSLYPDPTLKCYIGNGNNAEL